MSKNREHYNGRDFLKVRIIQGATKAGIHTDRRKEASRRACRRPVDVELEADEINTDPT